MKNDLAKSDAFAREILAQLETPACSTAWAQFLDHYSPLIMLVVRKYESQPDRVNDCYLYVCEKLCDNRFRRLRKFDPYGPATFRSWLNVVVANLCIDWKRHRDGRRRPFKSIRELPRLERAVFRYRFRQELNFQACFEMLKPEFPGLTEPRFASAVQRVSTALTPRQHFLLSTQRRESVSLQDSDAGSNIREPADPHPGPEQVSERLQQSVRLKHGLAHLPAQQRLLLKLRYEQELTLKEIARLMRLGDPFRAQRAIKAALKQLHQHIQS